MNIHECFTKVTPQLTAPEYGSEPSLYEIVVEYYADRIDDSAEAKQIAQSYIKEWIEQATIKMYTNT